MNLRESLMAKLTVCKFLYVWVCQSQVRSSDDGTLGTVPPSMTQYVKWTQTFTKIINVDKNNKRVYLKKLVNVANVYNVCGLSHAFVYLKNGAF